MVERHRRFGRSGSRLHATRQRHRIGNRALISPAAQRHAHAGWLWGRRGDRSCVWRSVGWRLLRLRIDNRQLLDVRWRRSEWRHWSAI
jgi:hypothetical protein